MRFQQLVRILWFLAVACSAVLAGRKSAFLPSVAAYYCPTYYNHHLRPPVRPASCVGSTSFYSSCSQSAIFASSSPHNQHPHTSSGCGSSASIDTKDENRRRKILQLVALAAPSSFVATLASTVTVTTGVVGTASAAVAATVPAAPESSSSSSSAGNEEAAASASRKKDRQPPVAPIENLLPATRVKVLIDRSVDLVMALNRSRRNNNPQQASDSSTQQQGAAMDVAELQNLLLEPRTFLVTKQEASTAQRYLQIDTLSEWTKSRRRDAEQQQAGGLEAIRKDDPLTRLNEEFEQWGERRQFRRLRRQQMALEQANPIRAAFNAYTNNLVFGDSYLLTASKDDKKQLLRNYDYQLPDVTSVIRSDLDLRDLYRNQVLTAMDEARAELQYQIRTMGSNNDDSSFDGRELEVLLKEGQMYCNKWFDFIPQADVQEAMSRVRLEEEKTAS